MNPAPKVPAGDPQRAGRSLRRELIRAHHPDLGGDPHLFIEVLESMDGDRVTRKAATEVRFVKRRRPWRSWRQHPRLRLRRQGRPARRVL